MVEWNGLSSKQVQRQQKQKKRTKNRNRSDATLIATLFFDALKPLNAGAARDLLMQPDRLAALLENRKGNDKSADIKCFYALHALLLILVNENCTDILNQMPAHDMATLKQCIAVAQKRKCPDATVITKSLSQRQSSGLVSESELLVNKAMIQSLQISLHVSAQWNDAVAELQKWAKAIDGFVRAPSAQLSSEEQSLPETQENESHELCTLDELANKLGFKDKAAFLGKKKRFVERYPNRAKVKEVKTWFVYPNGGRSALFRLAYLEELRTLLAAGNQKPFTVPVSQPVKNTKTLVDVRGIETYLAALQELCCGMRLELQEAENAYNKIIGQATKAKGSERRDLLQQAIKTNDLITQHQKTLNDFQRRVDNAKNLQNRRQQALDTLCAVDAEISKLLAEFKQHKK